VISVRNLWKVFGPGDPTPTINLARNGATRSEIQSETGHTIGVKDVSFSVESGESFVVMGLSGSGKSTLIRCLSGLHDITQGDVAIGGVELVGIGADRLRELRRSKMAMVFQHFGLFPHRKVIDNIAYGLEVQGVDKTTRRKAAGDVLSLVGLDGWADHYPDQLSGGMQQRVGLGRALALNPEILFFDEPFSALDPLIRHDMQDELLRLQTEQRRTIVFITHDFDEALRLGDRIAVMKDGVFEQVGKPEEVVAQPATPYVTAFTKSVPIGKVVKVSTLMHPPPVSHTVGPRTISANAVLEDVVPLFLVDLTPVTVVDERGRCVGVITGDAIATLYSGRQTRSEGRSQ
jgi:glycine betaine/proline transport system ATP-binding protein